MEYGALHGLITGGAGGLGKAFATALLEKKTAKLCLVDINPDGDSVVKELSEKFPSSQIKFYQADVSDHKQVKGSIDWCLEKFGYLNLIVNNAGIGAVDSDIEKCLLLFRINIEAVYCGTQFGMEVMNPANGGRGGMIINTASIAGLIIMESSMTYCGTKAGVIHLTRVAGQPCQEENTGVKVNCLCPWYTDTPILDQPGARETLQENNVEILEPAYVAEGFIHLLECGESGKVMSVTPQKGFHYHPYRDPLEDE